MTSQEPSVPLPCPFCGGTPEEADDFGGFIVSCQRDDCEITPGALGQTRADAIEAWNRRLSGGERAPVVPTNIAHELKVWPQYFDALLSGVKSFEFRKDDREPRFAVGDVLRLREWLPNGVRHVTSIDRYDSDGFTVREVTRRVTYVARGGVIPEGYCVMSLEPIQSSPDSVSAVPTDDTTDAKGNGPESEYFDALQWLQLVLLGAKAGETKTLGVHLLQAVRDQFREALLPPSQDGAATPMTPTSPVTDAFRAGYRSGWSDHVCGLRFNDEPAAAEYLFSKQAPTEASSLSRPTP